MEQAAITDETALIDEIIHGAKNKYELLIRKYNQRLYRVAKAILWNDEEAEDAMQEAYIKAYQKLPQFERRSGFSTWITRILINECLMKKRQNKAKATINASFTTEQLQHPADKSNPEKKVLNKELKALLESAISQLPEKYRLVFVMREIENMSVTETTEALEISETNTKARLSRAKEMLRNTLMGRHQVDELLNFHAVRCDKMVSMVYSRI